jgi:hypothetical protein
VGVNYIFFFGPMAMGLAYSLAAYMLQSHLSVSHKLKSEKGVFFPPKLRG